MKRTHLIAAIASLVAIAGVSQDAFARGRMYHPGLGRFTQRDPLGTAAAPPLARSLSASQYTRHDPTLQYADGMDLYEYVGSNPVMRLDPSGTVVVWAEGAVEKPLLQKKLKPLSNDLYTSLRQRVTDFNDMWRASHLPKSFGQAFHAEHRKNTKVNPRFDGAWNRKEQIEWNGQRILDEVWQGCKRKEINVVFAHSTGTAAVTDFLYELYQRNKRKGTCCTVCFVFAFNGSASSKTYPFANPDVFDKTIDIEFQNYWHEEDIWAGRGLLGTSWSEILGNADDNPGSPIGKGRVRFAGPKFRNIPLHKMKEETGVNEGVDEEHFQQLTPQFFNKLMNEAAQKCPTSRLLKDGGK